MAEDYPHFDVIFHYGAYPLWAYLKDILRIDITDVCKHVTKEEPVLVTDHGKLVARVVTLPFEPPALPSIYNNDATFLINSINVVFRSLQPGVERDGQKILSPFKFQKNLDGTLALVNATSSSMVNPTKAIAILEVKE